jgi:sulfate transport system substrate-binding protein
MKVRGWKKGLLAAALLSGILNLHAEREILNASYDISRELFEEINASFVKTWKESKGEDVKIKQSHGGSSKQARSILEGLDADVVTLNQDLDIEILAKGRLLSVDWISKFPNSSSPYYSLTSFVVRQGNPKGIKDWGDLAKPGVRVIFPNPKTSGNGRYTYLALWGWASEKFGGDEAKIQEFIGTVLKNVPILDTGGRGASTTFVERGIGDVLVTFEAESYAIKKQYGEKNYQEVTPSVSILADFPVAVVDRVASHRGTGDLAEGYLNFLYSPQGQEILAKNHYRVRDAGVATKYEKSFSKTKLLKVKEAFGGWAKVQKLHFDSGGTFDKIVAQNRS